MTQQTFWHMTHLSREALARGTPSIDWPLEVDEFCLGGKKRNKHVDKKLNAIRGTGDKYVVMGGRDRGRAQSNVQDIPNTTAETLLNFIEQPVDSSATVSTDNHRAYRDIPFEHESINHRLSEYVRAQWHVYRLESFGELLKRGYSGTHHHMSVEHLGRYIDEIAGLYDDRPSVTLDQIVHVVQEMGD